MFDVGSRASEPSAGVPALSREAKRQARATVKFQEKHGGRSQSMKAVEDYLEVFMPTMDKPKTKRELFETAKTLLMHGVGYCEDMCVSESADVSLDFQEIGEGRIRATMEISTVVSVECSKTTFAEKGGVSGMAEILIDKSKSALSKLPRLRPDTFKKMFCGDIERADSIVSSGLLMVLIAGDLVLTNQVVAEHDEREAEASLAQNGHAEGSDGRLASIPESSACRSAASPAMATGVVEQMVDGRLASTA